MKEKVHVTICSGTACFVMSASEILLLKDSLPAEFRDSVEIHEVACMAHCKNTENGKAPFVLVNNELVSEATLPVVIERIERFLGECGI
jgi:NADH:ubiquinone oxidoreductase subunit E